MEMVSQLTVSMCVPAAMKQKCKQHPN
jgi:hypothetical protein